MPSFSSSFSKERGFIKSLPGHSHVSPISCNDFSLPILRRIDLALWNSWTEYSNAGENGKFFSSNFPLESGFQRGRTKEFLGRRVFPFRLNSPFGNFEKTFVRTLRSLSWFASLLWSILNFGTSRFSQFLQNFVDAPRKSDLHLRNSRYICILKWKIAKNVNLTQM